MYRALGHCSAHFELPTVTVNIPLNVPKRKTLTRKRSNGSHGRVDLTLIVVVGGQQSAGEPGRCMILTTAGRRKSLTAAIEVAIAMVADAMMLVPRKTQPMHLNWTTRRRRKNCSANQNITRG